MKAKLWLRSSASMSVLLAGLSLLLWTDAAWAAFASGSSFCTAFHGTSATSWTFAPSAQLTAGNVGVIVLATDNLAITDGYTNDHFSMTDTAGNTWTKAREYTNTISAAVADAATVSVWYSKASFNLATSGNITVNLSGSIAAKAVTCWQFTMGAGNTIVVEGYADRSDDGVDAGSITLSGLPNIEHLFIRGTASEASGQTYTASTSYTTFDSTSSTFVGGATSTSMDARGEFRIFTATTDTTDPTMSASARDRASTMVALREVVGPAPAPRYQAAGGVVSGTSATLSVPWPAHAINDIGLLIIETQNQAVTLGTNAANWTPVTNSPQGTGTTSTGTQLTVFWSRATSTSMGNVGLTGTSMDHQIAQIITFRGVVATGNPWDVTAGDVTPSTTTAVSIPGATTGVPATLVVAIVSNGSDISSAQIPGSFTNSDLSSVTKWQDNNTTASGGGGFTVATGSKDLAGTYGPTSATLGFSSLQGRMSIALRPPVTTIADGTNPTCPTCPLAPGAVATDVDAFTLQTSSGTDTVTAATVTLAAGTWAGINLVQITDNSNVVLGTATDPGANTVPITLSTNISVTTTATPYKIRITPKSHANMLAVPGATYAVTATVTSFTSSNVQSGTDTASATVTIDNQSPADVTSPSATPGTAQVTVSWTNPGADFSNVVVLRNTATISDVPAEGTAPALNATVGTSVVRYISNGTSFTDTGLTGGTYYYKIFAKDASGNYSAGVQVSATVTSQSWYNTTWAYRKILAIDQTQVGATGAPHANFPVLVSRTDTDLQSKALSTGNDILFTSSDGTTKLSHEIEKYVSSTGELVAWVKVPSVSSSSATLIYMYYGNASAANQQDVVNTWDANFKAVWHLSQAPSGTAQDMKDSTVNANHGTSAGGMTGANKVAGMVGDGTNFDGVANQINLSGFSVITAPWMLEFWIRPVDLDTQRRFFFNLGNPYPSIDSKNTGQNKVLMFHGASTFRYGNKSWAAGDNNQWWQLVFVIPNTTTPSSWGVYLNGVDISDVAGAGGDYVAPGTSGNIGSRGSTLYFKGIMDEVRVSNAARSAGWILTEYNNQSSAATFFSSVSAEELRPISTTIADGTNPGNTTVAPGAAATDVDAFTLQTSGGTDTVTAATVTLAAGTWAGINLVQITDNSNVVMGTATDPGSNTVPITLSTNISVTTTATTYKIRITPKSHANMPAVPGATYAVTAKITSFTGSNAQLGTDTASATMTIDNQSPANVTSPSATAGSGQVTVSWTNPTDSDFTTGGNVVVLRNTATITDVPAEGSAPAVDATVGTSVVRYISNGTSFIDTGLTGGMYYYRIFAKDASGNYSQTGVEVSATVSVLPPTVGEVSFVENDATSSKTWLHTTSGTNRALLVGVSWSNGVTPTSVTYAGTAMTSIGSVFNGTSARVQLFYLLESALPASGTSNTVSVTLSSNAGQLVVGAVTLRGVNQTTPVGTFASATGSSTAPSVTATSNAGETVIDTLFTADDHVPTVGLGQTQQWNPGSTQGSGWGAGSTKPGASSVTMSWTTLSAAWAIGAVGVKPAAICSSVPNATYVSGETQGTQAAVYWSSSNPVLILRKTNAAFVSELPSGGASYNVNEAIGAATVVFKGAGGETSFTETGLATGNTYYYKVFPKTGVPCYAPGIDVSVNPVVSAVWSYSTTSASMAPPALDPWSNVVITGSNDNNLHGMADSDGTRASGYSPFLSGGPIQSRPAVIPANYRRPAGSGVNIAYVTSQDGYLYAVNTSTGQSVWTSPSLAGANKLQGGSAVWLQVVKSLSICGVTTSDVVFVGTKDTGTTTANKVYALNGSGVSVTTTAGFGGNCPAGATSVPAGGILWTYTGTAMDIISSTPYVDFTNNTVWVTSRSAGVAAQASVWKFNAANGALITSLNNTNLSESDTSASAGIDSSPVPNADGAFVYVGTNAGNLKAIKVSNNAVSSHTPSSGAGAIKGMPWPLSYVPASVGSPDQIIFSRTATVHSVKFDGTNFLTCPSANCWTTTPTGGPATVSTPVDDGAGNIYIGGSDGKVHRLLVSGGSDLAQVPATGVSGTMGDPTFNWDISKIHVGATDGHIYTFSIGF